MNEKNRIMMQRLMQALVEQLATKDTVTLYSVAGKPVLNMDMRPLQAMLG